MRRELGAVAQAERIDVAVQVNGLERRAKRLVVMDVDSTLIVRRGHRAARRRGGLRGRGRGDHGAGDGRRARLRGVAAGARPAAGRARRGRRSTGSAARIRLTPGARTFVRTLKRLGFVVGIVSGGFTPFTDACASTSGSTTRTRTPSRCATGGSPARCSGPVVDRARKAALLAEIAAARGRPAVADRGGRRRGERPRHARRRRPGHRLQRQAGGPGAGRHDGVGAVPGRDPVHARHPRRGRRARQRSERTESDETEVGA